MISKMTSFAQLVIYLKLALAGLRLGLKNRQVGEKWVFFRFLGIFFRKYFCKIQSLE
jgi:hypothetical protein